KPNNAPTFFVGFQHIQNRNANSVPGRMPTAAERAGDFSQSQNPLGQPVQIIDPLTGRPFDGNLIPAERITRQAQTSLNLFPPPNFNGNARYNYQIALIDVTHQDSLQTRLNKSINPRNQVFGNFDLQSTRTDVPNVFKFSDTTRVFGINTGINWTTRPTQRFSATFRYQFSRQGWRATPYFANRYNVSGMAGIGGNNQEAVNWGPPALTFTSGISALSDAQYSFNRNETNTVSYSSFWNRGRH